MAILAIVTGITQVNTLNLMKNFTECMYRGP